MKKKIGIFSIIFFLLDFVIKGLVRENDVNLTLIPHFFSLQMTKNYGAAFSLLTGKKSLLIGSSLVVFLFLLYEIWKKSLSTVEGISYTLVLAGLFGNLFDRLYFGYVTDYFSFTFFDYSFPVFNLADCFIVIGICLLLLDMIRRKEI